MRAFAQGAVETLKPDVREFISVALGELAALPLDASILVNGSDP